MRRSPFSFRGRWYNQAMAMGQLVPVYRRAVVPGMSVEIDGVVSMQTPPTTVVTMNPAVMDTYLFFVPNRLIWDGWVDWIVEGIGDLPEVEGAYPLFYDREGDPSLFRRAMKLIRNEYFAGNYGGSGEPPVPVNDATPAEVYKAVTLEGRWKDAMPGSAFDDQELTLPVVAGNVTIPLRQFAREMSKARAQFNQQISGDKYVDFLANLGVAADWTIQQAPELLGHWQQDLRSHYTEVTGNNTSAGTPRTKYLCQQQIKLGRKSFAEHGYVVGISIVRIATFLSGLKANDALLTDRKRWFVNDESNVALQAVEFGLDDGAANFVIPEGSLLNSGEHTVGRITTVPYAHAVPGGSISLQAATWLTSDLNASTELDGYTTAFLGDFRVKGLSPASNKPIFGA